MDCEKINMGAYNLHFIKTEKFKTISVSVNFRRPVKRQEITARKFLFSLLCDSTKKINSKRLMEIQQEELYLLNLGYKLQIFGNYINSSIDVKILNDKFSEPGITEKSLQFLFDIIFNPNIENDAFNEKNFNIIKNRIETTINSIKDNTDIYSLIKVLEEMDHENPSSFHTWGYIEDLNKITKENLYNYYLNVLNSDIIDIFIVGDIDTNMIKQFFQTNFRINTIKKQKKKLWINYNEYRKRIKKKIVEEDLLQQSKISVALKLINISDFERRYVFPIYAQILGGSAYSRLFQSVREKHSLAYNISAATKAPSSIMLITSGIQKENFEKTLRLIRKELKNITKSISDKELENAKSDILTNIQTITDNPTDIINYYFGREVLNSDEIKDKIKKFKKVTKEDIIKFGNKVKTDTVVLLCGRDKNEKDTD